MYVMATIKDRDKQWQERFEVTSAQSAEVEVKEDIYSLNGIKYKKNPRTFVKLKKGEGWTTPHLVKDRLKSIPLIEVFPLVRKHLKKGKEYVLVGKSYRVNPKAIKKLKEKVGIKRKYRIKEVKVNIKKQAIEKVLAEYMKDKVFSFSGKFIKEIDPVILRDALIEATGKI